MLYFNSRFVVPEHKECCTWKQERRLKTVAVKRVTDDLRRLDILKYFYTIYNNIKGVDVDLDLWKNQIHMKGRRHSRDD